MTDKITYTKLFLRMSGQSINDTNVKAVLPQWWYNTRTKDVGGLRLTDEGFEIIQKIDITTFEIPFPRDMTITTQIIIYLDKFIDCPYYLTNKSIFVTHEKRAVELTLFSGDLRKYGLAKAMTREKNG